MSAEPLLESVSLDGLPIEMIQWLIIGGESGARARPFDLQVAADIMREAKEQGVPVFMKQLGRKLVARDRHSRERLLQLVCKSGDDTAEWPRNFRVRRLPEPARHNVAPPGSTGGAESPKK